MPVEKKKVEDYTKFETIIELLFGDQIRKYDDLIEQMNTHIQKLEKQLLDNKKDYNNKMQLLSGEIAGNLQNLDEAFSTKLQNGNKKIDDKLIQLNRDKIDKKILTEKLSLLIDALAK